MVETHKNKLKVLFELLADKIRSSGRKRHHDFGHGDADVPPELKKILETQLSNEKLSISPPQEDEGSDFGMDVTINPFRDYTEDDMPRDLTEAEIRQFEERKKTRYKSYKELIHAVDTVISDLEEVSDSQSKIDIFKKLRFIIKTDRNMTYALDSLVLYCIFFSIYSINTIPNQNIYPYLIVSICGLLGSFSIHKMNIDTKMDYSEKIANQEEEISVSKKPKIVLDSYRDYTDDDMPQTIPDAGDKHLKDAVKRMFSEPYKVYDEDDLSKANIPQSAHSRLSDDPKVDELSHDDDEQLGQKKENENSE